MSAGAPTPAARRARWSRGTARAASTAAAVALALLALPAAAQAAPTLTIASPAANEVTADQTPQIRVESSEPVAYYEHPVVTVTLAGPSEVGPIVATADERNPEQAWTATPASRLVSGTYTATAVLSWVVEEVENPLTKEKEQVMGEATSPPLSFTVETFTPEPSITSPANGATLTSSTVAVSGNANAQAGAQVTVQLYTGSSVGSVPTEALSVPQTGGRWSATFGALGTGTYTVRAQQSGKGGTGTSAPVTFRIATPPAPPAPPPPVAAFTWIPAEPHVGETVTLVSASTDAAAPITALAWSVAGAPFATGGPLYSTTFTKAGTYPVQLRVTDAGGRSSVATKAIVITPVPLVLMEPFPIVRIVGSLTHHGARIALLSVQTLVEAHVTVSCRGRGCPIRAVSKVARAPRHATSPLTTVTFPRFQRSLPAGVVLDVRVSKPGDIGKFTRFTIRHGRIPARFDACLTPANSVIGCPQ